MATWKERGEVPDSDDDEDLESLSSDSLQNQNNEVCIDETERHNPWDLTQHGSYGGIITGEAIGEEGEVRREKEQSEEALELPGALLSTLTAGSFPRSKETTSSLSSLEDLEFPPEWPGQQSEDENEEELNHNIPDVRFLSDGHHPTDEISKSYVQITSASLALPSALLGSLPRLSANIQSNDEASTIPMKRKEVTDQADMMPAVKRTFRQRKAIQINPYGIESLDYNRTCRESGIKPTRIVDIEERRRISPSAEPDSQVIQSQNLNSDDGFIATEDSQEIDHIFDKPAPSTRKREMPLQSQDLDQVINHFPPEESDEEFPPIEDLLQSAKVIPQLSAKKRQKTYSTKIKRPPPSKLRTAQTSSPQSRRQSSIFDLPTSPLAISSPFPNFDRGSLSRTTSGSSSILPTPSRRPNVRVEKPQPASKPTSSTPKSLSEPLHVYSDSEMAYPFLNLSEPSDTDEEPAHISGADLEGTLDLSDASSLSSNESVEIRRVGRRIRGVLPASHLRLDSKNKKKIVPPDTRQGTRSVSPAIIPLRRGVALPTVQRSTQRAPANTGMRFLEGISDDEEDEAPAPLIQTQRTALSSLFAQSRVGDAEEDDSIDHMLPSQKRHRVSSKGGLKKRRKMGHSGQAQGQGFTRQPTITQHLGNPQASKTAPRKDRPHKKQRSSKPRPIPKVLPPELSILDVTDTLVDNTLPLFIRIAARTARAKKSHGRQSPTKKIIMLANREDTADARSVLLDWRSGVIQPKDLSGVYRRHNHVSDSKTTRIGSFEQSLLPSPTKKVRPQQARHSKHPGVSRKLLISNGVQQSMNEFVLPKHASTSMKNLPRLYHHKESLAAKQPRKRQINFSIPRQAQLESLELELPDEQNVPSFRSSKSTLDRFYRAARKRALLQASIPLNRFIADKDPIHLQATPSTSQEMSPDIPVQSVISSRQTIHLRKRRPRRLDIGAAEYRQPNNPLILEYLAPVVVRDESVHSKLLNLGKYGTSYPISFDVLHLPPGVFFHESTLIGSGRLAEALKDVEGGTCHSHSFQPSTSLSLGTKQFSWGVWDEHVSSEVGICFDWIVDQYSMQDPISLSPSVVNSVDVLDYVWKYVHSVTFSTSQILEEFLSRMKAVLDEFTRRLEKAALLADSRQADYTKIMGRCILLCLRLLLLARSAPTASCLAFELEDMLTKLASSCIKILIANGLGNVRKLYDDLQYVSIRDRGVQSDEPVFEAWVIILKSLNKARVPRGSFLDVVNSVLLSPESRNTQDARSMENTWYSLFTLLPLSEFDEHGVVIPDPEHKAAFDNWALPQQMLKRVFELYNSDRRQSPGFNDYCRSIVSRCHYLMVEWGWWKCSGVIGTLFDFFASQNLAHLRNEEVSGSPHFLQELHLHPSLSVEPEDRCFHIFLKIVALGVKHFGEVNNDKGVRNLVARLLPNHDRQYPKEEEIRQSDLACLRNHHDLLCTLFWSAPPQHRPSVRLLQALVDPSHSHTQAILINIRSWENLARFIISTSLTSEMYRSITGWQHWLFDGLWQQHQNTEDDLRSQAARLLGSSASLATEDRIADITMRNQNQTMALINTLLEAVHTTINVGIPGTWPISILQNHVYTEFLGRLLDLPSPTDCGFDTVIDIIEIYARIVGDSVEEASSEDSQDLAEAISDKFEALSKLANDLLGSLHRCLIAAVTNGPSRVSRLMSCWVKVVHLVVGSPGYEISQFVGQGRFAVVDDTKPLSLVERNFWVVFLTKLVHCPPGVRPAMQGIDLPIRWLRLLVLPYTMLQNQAAIDILRYLLDLSEYWTHSLFGDPQEDAQSLLRDILMSEKLHTSEAILNCTLNSMKLTVSDATNQYRTQLGDALGLVQMYLEGMLPGSKEHTQYEMFVRQLVGNIKRHCTKFFKIPAFFNRVSSCYQPNPDDPNMFIDTALYYSEDLSRNNTNQTANTFLQVLVFALDGAFTRGELRRHTSHLKKAMKVPEFLDFVIVELWHPILWTAVHTTYGWSLCHAYFPQMAEVLSSRMLGEATPTGINGHNDAALLAFKAATKLLDMIVSTLLVHQERYLLALPNSLPVQWDVIIALMLSFWYTLRPIMIQHAESLGATERLHFNQTVAFFNKFVDNLNHLSIGTPDLFPAEFYGLNVLELSRGTHHENYLAALQSHAQNKCKWRLSRDGENIIFELNGKTISVSHLNVKKVITREEEIKASRALGGARRLLKGMTDFRGVARAAVNSHME